MLTVKLLTDELLGIEVTPGTITYICILLQPILDTILSMTTDEIITWIPQALTHNVENRMLAIVNEHKEEEEEEKMKKQLINLLICLILDPTVERAQRIWKRPCVSPWDIQETILNNIDLCKILGVESEDNVLTLQQKLPVTVKTKENEFTILMSEEYVVGLYIASHTGNTIRNNFDIFVFGSRIDKTLLRKYNHESRRYRRVSPESNPKYIAYFKDFTFEYNTVDFITGFTIGMGFIQLDPSQYLTSVYDCAQSKIIKVTLI